MNSWFVQYFDKSTKRWVRETGLDGMTKGEVTRYLRMNGKSAKLRAINIHSSEIIQLWGNDR